MTAVLNFVSISILAILAANFAEIYAAVKPFEEHMKKYSGGSLTRKVPVNLKPNQYTLTQYLNYGSGTAIYKTKYNEKDVALKLLDHKEKSLKKLLKNEEFILKKLKVEGKNSEELGYIEMYDFIDEGELVAKPETSVEVLQVMAMIVTCIETDFLDYLNNQPPEIHIYKDVDLMRSFIYKIIEAFWHVHQRGIIHNDVATQNIGLIGDKIVLFDFGISVVYNSSAKVEDMIYFINGSPIGVKSNLSWDAVTSGDKHIRKFVDDIISAILSIYSGHGALPWHMDCIETAWNENRIEDAKVVTKMERSKYHDQNYTNMAKYYKENYNQNLSPKIDKLLQTLYTKVIANPTNIDYQDLLEECQKPL